MSKDNDESSLLVVRSIACAPPRALFHKGQICPHALWSNLLVLLDARFEACASRCVGRVALLVES